MAIPGLAFAETEAPATPTPLPPGLRISGYLQTQYEAHADSEDEFDPDGGIQNQDFFRVPRIRLRFQGDWGLVGTNLQLSGSTGPRGHTVGLHRAEGILRYRPDPEAAPLLEGALGLMKIPFGYELYEGSGRRPFMERSLIVRSLFPSSSDIGVRAGGAFSAFHWALAAVNGIQPGFTGVDPNASKDILLRLGFGTDASSLLRFSGDVSFLQGLGFHPGTDTEPSENFHRWAFGVDAQVEVRTALGRTRLLGEAIVAENLDRNFFPSDPIAADHHARQFGYYAAIVQDLGDHAYAGFRFDSYDPDTTGRTVSRTIQTFSPVVALVLPGRARLFFQYDFVRDVPTRDGAEPSLPLLDDGWTLRLQVDF